MSNHPHIVEMKGAFLTPFYLAVVMEYVEGETIEVVNKSQLRSIPECAASYEMN